MPAHRALCPGDEPLILAAAADALAHRVTLLGPDAVELGAEIDWSRDFKSGVAWPRRYMRDIELRQPRRRQRRQGPLGALPSPVADARRSGLPAHGRGALRRGRARDARELDRRQSLRPFRQLVVHDGGRAAGPELDLVLSRLPRQPVLGRRRLPRALPVRALSARRLHRAAPRDLGRQRQPLHCRCGGARFRRTLLRARRGRRALADARLVASERGASAAGVPGRRRLRGVGRVPPPGRRAVPAARALPAGLRARCAGPLSRAADRDGAFQRGLLAHRRDEPALGRRGRRARPAARSAGAHRPPLPRRPRGRGVRGSGARERFGRPARRGFLAARAALGRLAARVRNAAAAAGLHGISGRRLLRDAQRGRPRLHRLRTRGPRRPRRARPQRLPGLRGRARRRPARARLRLVRLHRLVRRAQPLSLDGVSQHAARRRPGDQPDRSPAAVDVRERRTARSCSRSKPAPSATASVARTRATRGCRLPSRPSARSSSIIGGTRSRFTTASMARDITGSRCRCTSPSGSRPRSARPATSSCARPADASCSRGIRTRPGRSRSGPAGSRRATESLCRSSGCSSDARDRSSRASRCASRPRQRRDRRAARWLGGAGGGQRRVRCGCAHGLAAAFRFHARRSGNPRIGPVRGSSRYGMRRDVARDQRRSLLARRERRRGESPQPRFRASGHERGGARAPARGRRVGPRGGRRVRPRRFELVAGPDARIGRRSAPARAPALGHRGRRPG